MQGAVRNLGLDQETGDPSSGSGNSCRMQISKHLGSESRKGKAGSPQNQAATMRLVLLFGRP